MNTANFNQQKLCEKWYDFKYSTCIEIRGM